MSRKFLFILISFLVVSAMLGIACVPAVSSAKVSSGLYASAPQDAATPTPDSGSAQPTAAATDASQPAAATTPAASGSTGTVLADSGFRADKNGLPFQNYGPLPGGTNLTADDMNAIYGDSVCANKANGTCNLIPPAQQWMEQVNNSMSGGHCYGFAEFASLVFQNKLNPTDFGGTSMTDLKLDGNTKLQRELAKDWVAQKFQTVRAAALAGTPNALLDKLIETFKGGATAESYVVAFFKRDMTGGHAVTPYAVEDRGNGIYALMVYDNNYPGQAREFTFDRKANSWKYEASINPSVKSEMYDGDKDTNSFFLFPVTPALQPQTCSFCAANATAKAINGLAAAQAPMNQIYLDGEGDLLIADKAGHKLGRVNGKIVNEIPGASFELVMSDDAAPDTYSEQIEPTYYVPADLELTITVDGTNLKEKTQTNVVVIGPGYDLGVEGINLDPKQVDTMTVSPKTKTISYKTASSESPSFILGVQLAGADYEFTIKGAAMDGGGQLNVNLDEAKAVLSVNASGIKTDAKVSMIMNRIDDKTEETFENDEVALKAGDSLNMEYGKWKGNGQPIEMTVTDAKGAVVDTYTSADEK